MEKSCCPVKIRRGNPLHYIRIFTNCCYYMCIIPFRFVLDEEENNYIIRMNRIQKVLCILLWFMCFCEEVLTFRETIEVIRSPRKALDDPWVFFNVLSTLANMMYYITVARTVWWNSKHFLAIIQYLHHNRDSACSTSARNRHTNIKAAICVTLTFIPFVIYPTTFIGSMLIRRGWTSWADTIDHWSLNGFEAFFLEDYHSQANLPLKIFFAILRTFYLICYTQLTTAMDMLILNCAMLLFDVVQDFGDFVRDSTNYACEQVLLEYRHLRTLSRKMNKAVGFLTFGIVLACMPFYVLNLLNFIKPDNVVSFIRYLMVFTNNFGFLTLAAHINKKAHMLEEWLITGRQYTEIDSNTLSILLHDLSGRNIGFSGSGFFTITPAFLGTILSLLLTFSIIIIQFKTSVPVTSAPMIF